MTLREISDNALPEIEQARKQFPKLAFLAESIDRARCKQCLYNMYTCPCDERPAPDFFCAKFKYDNGLAERDSIILPHTNFPWASTFFKVEMSQQLFIMIGISSLMFLLWLYTKADINMIAWLFVVVGIF